MATVTSSKRHLLVTSDTYTSNGDVTVGGDLYVNGSQTTINTATLSVEDKNITLNYGGTASSSQGAGITITGSNATLLWDHANTKWTLSDGLSVSGNITASNLSGTNTGDQDLSGYALTSHNHDGRYIRLDTATTPTNKVTFGYGVSDLNNVGGGHGVTGFRSTFQASNRPGSGNYATGVEFTYHDTGARTQFVAASSGQNTTPELWVRGEAWGSTPSWGDWYQIYHENHKPTPVEIGAQPAGNYETDDGSGDRYVFKVDLSNLANVTRWYKVATVNIGNGGLLMRGSLTNHVESFGSTKFDLTIQGREGNASDQIEITGSVDVFDDNTGVYIVKSAVSGSYTTYDVYIECYNYTQAWVELIKTGLTTFDTSGNYVTTSPSGLVELDTSAYGEGSYTIIDSENRFSIRKISANTTQISGNAPSSPVLRIGANNQNQIYMDGSTVTINDNMETEKIFINSIDTNTTSTTALVLNNTEVEKRTLGSAAFAAVGDFAANGHTHIWGDIDNTKYASGTSNMISSATTGSPSSSATIVFDDSGGVNKIALSSLDLSLMDNSTSGFLTSGSTQSKYLRSDANDTGTGIITLSQNNSTTPYPLIVKNVSNANGVGIEFDDNLNGTQRGYIKHFHSDTKSYGSGASMIISSSETTTTILADGKLMYAEGIYSKPGSGTGAGTRKDQNWDTAYTHSQSAHAPANAEQNVQSNWNESSSSSDAFIQNKPTIPSGSQLVKLYNNVDYIASGGTSGTYRDNYGPGLTVYEGYSTGANRPHTYDTTLQVMSTTAQGFEISADWVSSTSTPLKVRSLRDCCQGWNPWTTIWTENNFSQTNINNWNTAYNNHITGIAVTGTSTKTITLTQQDGGTITATFTDQSGSAAETDTLATVTARGASTTTSCTFNTITMNTPVVGSSNKIKFANNDFIRFDDANGVGRFHFDCDGATNNASVQAATFVGALSGNASTASSAAKWTTARTITLSGDLNGSVSIDGSSNVTLSAQVVNNSHQHSKLYEESTITYGGSYLQWTDQSGTGGAGTNGTAPGNPFSDWFHHLIMNHGNSSGYYVDIAACFHSDDVYFRRNVGGSITTWREFIHSGNIGSQSVSNADKVDNLHASDFLRSNANDSFTGDELHFPTLDLSISNNNSQNQGNTYFRGSGTHFVLGLNSGNTLYLNYGNSAGQFRAYGNAMYWNDNNIGTPWGSGNDGSGTGLDADYVDGYHASNFFRRIHKASANVGPGWVTVAENTSGRKAGEIIVTDGDSGDHAYIRIEWMRSYADSHWTVLNTGGHSNRITGVRVLRDGDNTYGNKKLQVYCTVQSTYEVNIFEQGDIDDYGGHSVVTPVVQNSISGYSVHGNSYQNLDTYPFSVDQGIQGLKVRTDTDFSLGSSGKLIWENGYGNPYIQDYYGSININAPLYLGASGTANQDLHANNVKGNNFVDKDNSSYSLTPSSSSTGYWQVNTPSGFVQIGPANTSWSHFNTDRAAYYFNKKIIADSGVFGSYDEDVQLIRANSTSDRILIRATSIGFFLDSAEDMRLENDGDLHVEGDVIAFSSTISDEKLKDNVLTIDGALDKVCKLRGVEYTWNKGSRKDTRDLGVIAQEVEQVIPEIVREKKMPLIDDSEETYKTVDYEKLTAVLIEAVKELKAEVADLKQQINEK